MERDIELIRAILLAVEAKQDPFTVNYPPEDVSFHLWLMIKDQNLIRGNHIGERQWHIMSLTWAGFELLEMIRDDTRWRGINRILTGLNCYSVDIMRQVASKLMDQ